MIQKYQTKITKQASFGSSIKACKIAEGEAEISYRLSDGTKEWDTAASQLIVEEAGGLFIKPDGTRYLYNRKNVKNTEGYLIVNRKENILL
jgi:3'(2'), 5'-bisphosphate nucleotidase